MGFSTINQNPSQNYTNVDSGGGFFVVVFFFINFFKENWTIKIEPDTKGSIAQFCKMHVQKGQNNFSAGSVCILDGDVVRDTEIELIWGCTVALHQKVPGFKNKTGFLLSKTQSVPHVSTFIQMFNTEK